MAQDLQLFELNNRQTGPGFRERLNRLIWVQQLSSPAGLLILLAVSLLLGYMVVQYGVVAGALILVALFAPPILYGIVVYPLFGIAVLLIMAYMLFYIMRFGINFPMGTLMDGIQALLVLGFFIQQKRRPDWSVFRGPVSLMILLWIGYNIIQVANPAAESRLAWLYTIRTVAVVMIMYFVFMYQIRTVKAVRFYLKLWLLLSFIAALYAFKQEYIGFSAAEDAWLHSDPLVADLLFIAGRWRKFSIFSDPVAFSYNMVVSSILCIALLTYVRKIWHKVVLSGMIVMFFMSMLFSGTRGAYVLLPAALVLFVILRFNMRVLIGTAIAGVFILFLILVPTADPNIVRFQTAFQPSDDPSFNLRSQNQKRIQPYILTHPMGGGLGATGTWGMRFSPHSYLANFPPDSGYVRVAVELGWIGLLLFCTLMFFILREGINNYFTIQNKELKTYCLGMLLIVFAYNVGNYPQEALVQFPSNTYFYLAVALINITKRIDTRLIEQKENALL